MTKGAELKAVLFDMDGVIIDSEPLWTEAERRLLARRKLRCSPALKGVLMGRNSWEAVRLLKEHYSLRERLEDLIQERNQLIAELFGDSLQPIPDVLTLLEAIVDRGIKTALVSSSSKSLVELVLEKLKISELFDLIISGDHVARGKPAPDIYVAAARELCVAAEDCLVIEDAPNGVAAAKAAGMSCLAISTSASRRELAAADRVVSSFREVDLSKLQELLLETQSIAVDRP